jgi:hypothetical protein
MPYGPVLTVRTVKQLSIEMFRVRPAAQETVYTVETKYIYLIREDRLTRGCDQIIERIK